MNIETASCDSLRQLLKVKIQKSLLIEPRIKTELLKKLAILSVTGLNKLEQIIFQAHQEMEAGLTSAIKKDKQGKYMAKILEIITKAKHQANSYQEKAYETHNHPDENLHIQLKNL